MRLAIIGAGDLGLQLAHLAQATGQYSLAGFLDDTLPVGTSIAGAPVLGPTNAIDALYAQHVFDCLIVGIGYRHLAVRQALFLRHVNQIPFATLIHPSATVDPTCHIDVGAVIYAGCVLDMEARVDGNALLNAGCVIAHHSRIGAGSFLSPAVSVAGFVDVEPGCVLGIGTVVIDNVRIVSGVRTGAGAVVTRSLDRPGLYLGIPARFANELSTA